MEKSQKRWLFISLGISFAVLFVMLILTIDISTLDGLQKCNPWIILLAFAMHILSLGFWALRIKLMCRSLGYKVPFFHSFNLVCSNMFLASVTPSQIGGEPVRIYELTRVNVPGGEATAVVIMERVFDGIVLAAGTVISVFLLGMFFADLDVPEAYMIIAYIAAFVFAALLLAFLVVAKNPVWANKVVNKLLFLLSRNKSQDVVKEYQKKIDIHLERFYATLGHFTGKSKSGMFYGLVFSALYWVNELIIASVLMVGLGLPPNFLLAFIFMIMITVIMMIPLTPGGVGVAEVSMAGFFALIIPTALLGVFVLLWRLIMYYFNLVIGFIASMIIVRREAKIQKKEPINL
ncbi:MAG TPA: flippase-like domain-containing protein [Methanocorpusculum sp.]|nr:flippase-like domain-containing protein [Methanocorpusculum sp.]HKL98130.1 flippase-like domain-containing protein [Methanocorpusculum sp.]